jgi:acyl-CoA thioester hydrolase
MRDKLDVSLKDPAGFTHWITVGLRFRDLDLLGHVNNVNLVGWLEDGRVALELPVQPCTTSYRGPVIVLLDLHVQYLEEIHLGDEVKVGTRIQKIGTTSIVLGQAVFANGKPAAIAEVVEVLIDQTSRKPTAWPAEFRALFERYLKPA